MRLKARAALKNREEVEKEQDVDVYSEDISAVKLSKL